MHPEKTTDYTADLTVHKPDPEGRTSRDNVVVDGQVMSRAEADAMIRAKKGIEPKTGHARLKELQNLAASGKIPNSLYARLRQDVTNGGTGEFTEADLNAERTKQRQLTDASEYKQADDRIFDYVEGLEQRFINGGKIDQRKLIELEDRWRQLVGTAGKLGYGTDAPRLRELRNWIDEKKVGWRYGR